MANQLRDSPMVRREDWFEAERLHRAARDGDIVEVSYLVRKGFDINAFDDLSRAPLHYAVEENQYEAAQLLLSLGADVNRYEDDKIGETPLNIAAQGVDPRVVMLLLEHGANPDVPGWLGQTARFRASRRNDEAGRQIAAIIEAGG